MDYRSLISGCGGCARRRAILAGGLEALIDPDKAINLHSTRSATQRIADADLIGAGGVDACYEECLPNFNANCGATGVPPQCWVGWRRIWTTSLSRYRYGMFIGTIGSYFDTGDSCEVLDPSLNISFRFLDALAAQDNVTASLFTFDAPSGSNPDLPLCAGGSISSPSLQTTINKPAAAVGFVPTLLDVVTPVGSGNAWFGLAIPFFDDIVEP